LESGIQFFAIPSIASHHILLRTTRNKNNRMEKYRLVQEHKAEGAELLEPFPVSTSSFPEVRITQQGKPRNYISHAMSLFVSAKYKKQLLRTTSTKVHGGYSSDRVSFMLGMYVCTHQCVLSFVFPPCSPTQGDGSSTVVLKAMGRAINKAVTICEILKRKMPLYQSNALSSVEMIDVYEPVEEGLDVVTSLCLLHSDYAVADSIGSDAFGVSNAVTRRG
jgi:hypothetical protein